VVAGWLIKQVATPLAVGIILALLPAPSELAPHAWLYLYASGRRPLAADLKA